MRCTNCNKESDNLLTLINKQTGKMDYICDNCLIASAVSSINDIDELDQQILLVEKGLETSRYILENTEQMDLSDLDDDIASMAMTPLKIYKSFLKYHQEFKEKKKKILDSLSDKERFSYELKKALEKEDYENAAIIRDRINNLNNS